MAMKTANDNAIDGEYPDFIYKPINPRERYDRKAFVDAFDEFSDLEKYLNELIEDPRKTDTLAKLGNLIYGIPSIYIKADDPLLARTEGQTFHDQGRDAMEAYVRNNFEDFLDRCRDSGLEGYVINSPTIYKTTGGRGQSRHNEFVDNLNAFKNIAKIAQEGKPEQVRGYVQEKISNAPEWLQNLIGNSVENPEYAKIMFGAFAKKDQEKFFGMLRDKKGKTNRKFVENVIRSSIKEAYHQLSIEKDPGKQSDIRKDVIRPAYVNLARAVFPTEKKEEKKDKDINKVKRQRAREELGMAA